MKRFNKISRAVRSAFLALFAFCILHFAFVAKAQRGFDEFGNAVTVVLMGPTPMTFSANVISNAPMDLHMFTGIAKLDVSSWTNAGGTVNLNCYSSPDMTNWTLIPNFAVGTNTNFKMTNLMFGGTNLFTTNTYNLPYVVTAGNGTNGFTTSFNSYSPAQAFTNTFPLAVTKQGIYTLGFSVDDIAGRYFIAVLSGTGANTNGTFSEVLTAQPSSQLYPTQ